VSMQPRRAHRVAPIVIACLVLAVFACGVYLALFGSALFGDPEQRAINRTRAANFARAALNLRLDGTPDLDALDARLASHGLTVGAPVLVRIFKRDFELELWMARDGRYHRFATYPICRWSGKLGPKLIMGDKQAPEGFYTVSADQMNPNSRWHRSFNVGFPNMYDAAHGRTGSALMVHGGCSSAGCYAMTNTVIDEIWKLTTAALASGKQKRFQVQIFPFRLSEENLVNHAGSPHIGFWRDIKRGYDLFETNWLPPIVGVCQRTYHFKAGKTLEVAPVTAANCTQGDANNTGTSKKSL
jgi:murein L,D-transpeptidase YafK